MDTNCKYVKIQELDGTWKYFFVTHDGFESSFRIVSRHEYDDQKRGEELHFQQKMSEDKKEIQQ